MSNMKRFLSIVLCALLGLQLCFVAGASPFKTSGNAPAGGVDEEVFYLDGVIINAKESSTVSYRTDVTIVATATNVPDHLTLAVYEGGTLKENGTNKSVTYSAGEMTSSRSFTIKLIDVNKTVQKRSDGSEITAPCEITVNGGFFARIVAFFRSLFGTLPKEVIEQKPSYRECTLYFDANGGTDAPERYTGYGKIQLTYAWPERNGFEFLGWAITPYATQAQYQGGDIFNLTTDTTLFAVWEEYSPSTVSDIVNCFNNSSEKVKTDATFVTRNYSVITLAGDMTIPSSLNNNLKILGGADSFVNKQLEKNSKTVPEAFTGNQIKSVYPVENEFYSSILEIEDVKSATCTENDGKYTITITTVADEKSSTVEHGQGHAPKAFNTVLPDIVNENVPGAFVSTVGTASVSYPSCTVKAVIDKETGRVISSVYDIYWTIYFDEVGVVIPFVTRESYSVNYGEANSDEEIICIYNYARNATNPAPEGYQTLSLVGEITGDGATSPLKSILNPAIEHTLDNNSKAIYKIPAFDHADIKVSDVRSATIKDDGNGNSLITIYFKDQIDGPDGDTYDGGPAARGVGTLGNIDDVIAEIGAEITEGRDTVTLTYTDVYLKNVKINQKTGEITGGEWHYLVKIHIGNAKIKMGIAAQVQNLEVQIDYKAVI